VQWRLLRKKYYERRIRHALLEYVGIETEIFVESDAEGTFVPPPNMTAKRLPRSSSRPDPIEIARPGNVPTSVVSNGEVCANSQAAIELNPSSPELVEPPKVVQANYEFPDDPPPQLGSLPAHQLPRREDQDFVSSEIVTVIVRVPQSLIDVLFAKAMQNQNDSSAVSAMLDQLKNEIIERIRPLLPKASFATGLPISVIMPPELSGPRVNSTKTQTNMGKLLQRVWPLAAVTLIAIFTAVWIRGRQKPASIKKQNVEFKASDESESQILQGHLASLIDRDPETAAKVIKNWIRQSS
jgi:hypothetical protein